MKYLFLTNSPPLKPLLDFNIELLNIDLHNDFKCKSIEYNSNKIEFTFKRNEGDYRYTEENAKVIFSEILESNFNFVLEISTIDSMQTLMNFAKGELTQSHKYFFNKNIKYFFIDFESEKLINIFCKEAIVILW